jgi:hypothetical protein
LALSVTLVPKIAATVVPAVIPVPDTVWFTCTPPPDATTTAFDPLVVLPVVAVGHPATGAAAPVAAGQLMPVVGFTCWAPRYDAAQAKNAIARFLTRILGFLSSVQVRGCERGA